MHVPAGKVLVALSGGPDSTALLLMLLERRAEVVAAHYDHALQPASAETAAHVARLCEAHRVTLIAERRTQPLPSGSLQAAARSVRYAFLERAAAASGASAVAIAHTADDVVEGAVLHLLRGSGFAGLRGMPERRGIFVRPILHLWRREVEAFLEERGVVAVRDPANHDRRFARARVRHDVLPSLERDRPGIKRRLFAAAARAAALQALVEAEAEAVVSGSGARLEALRRLSEPVAAEAVRIMFSRAGGAQPGLSRAQIAAALALATGGGRGGRGVDLPGGLRFRVVGPRAEVVPSVPPLMRSTLETRPCTGCDAKDAVHLKRGLTLALTHRRPGMRIHLRRGTRKLQDVLVDARVPREERDAWPLVMAGSELAWIPGVAVDERLVAPNGELAQHVAVIRMLAGSQKSPC